MIPSINDFTSHWNLYDSHLSNKYIGILFGENILVYNNQVINLTKLFNDNGRIYNVVKNKKYLFVLLDNNNLYKIKIANFKTHELICRDVKNIFSYNYDTYILQINGNILNDKMAKTHKNISVVANIPRCCSGYLYIHVYDNKQKFYRFKTTIKTNDEIQNNDIKNVDDICIVNMVSAILYNNNVIMCNLKNKIIMDNNKFKNVICISAVTYNIIGIIYGDNNAVKYKISGDSIINLDNLISYKSISIPNSPYCAKFNAQNIPYYPKYFMDRFIAFVMSVKYGCNTKLPKYLYFMIADCLR